MSCWTLAGYQKVVKGHYRAGQSASSRDLEGQYVVIFLVVFRLAQKGTDIVVTLNYPLDESENIEMIHNPDTRAILNWIDTAPGVRDAEKVFKEIIGSFEILDWGLFDQDEDDEE